MWMRYPERLITALALVLVALAPAVAVVAQERATAEEARELVDRAIALYDEAGRDAAFAAFEDPDGGFITPTLSGPSPTAPSIIGLVGAVLVLTT